MADGRRLWVVSIEGWSVRFMLQPEAPTRQQVQSLLPSGVTLFGMTVSEVPEAKVKVFTLTGTGDYEVKRVNILATPLVCPDCDGNKRIICDCVPKDWESVEELTGDPCCLICEGEGDMWCPRCKGTGGVTGG